MAFIDLKDTWWSCPIVDKVFLICICEITARITVQLCWKREPWTVMPSFRRTSLANRTHSSNTSINSGQQRVNHNNCTSEPSSTSNSNSINFTEASNSDSTTPKHISISYPSSDHALVYETVVLVFSFSAFSLQLLHLYRTVWWLPQSYTQFALVI